MDMKRLDLDRFVNDRNVQRYRKLAWAGTTRSEREKLLDLLAAENDRCFGRPVLTSEK
jgi:hypothetical protein